jgi:hypothetical protein
MPHPVTRFAIVFSLAAGIAAAQDLLGVSWAGQVVRIDSATGAATAIGTGLLGQNSLARDANGVFWSSHRTGSTVSTWVHHFTTIDPNTGAATIVHSNVIDIRGMASAGGTMMWGIHNTVAGSISSIDDLVLIDMATGAITTIGSTGIAAIQGLALHAGTLYAWDINIGLVTIDTTTGAATDPFPGTSGPSGLQALCSHPDGRLLVAGGAANSLYVVDTTTGGTTAIGPMTGTSDIRGVEPFGGAWRPIGQPCRATFGPATLTVSGSLSVGGTMTSTSINHAPGSLGVLILGLSSTSHLGNPLPFSVDPILGTIGCNLFVSIEALLTGFTGAGSPASLSFTLSLGPPFAGAVFHVQHAVFEPTPPGGMSWSNGATIQVAP